MLQCIAPPPLPLLLLPEGSGGRIRRIGEGRGEIMEKRRREEILHAGVSAQPPLPPFILLAT